MPLILTPNLLYQYDITHTSIKVQNLGSQKATAVTIGIDPNHKIPILNVTTSGLSGEPIINYPSDENRFLYYINHMYPNDTVYFKLKIDKNLQKQPDTVDVIIRSNEAKGTEVTAFFVDWLPKLQIAEIVVWLIGSFMIIRVVMGYLGDYMEKLKKNNM